MPYSFFLSALHLYRLNAVSMGPNFEYRACKVFLVLSDGKRKDSIAAIRRAGKDLFNNIQSSFLIRACNWLHLIFPAALYGIYQQAHVFVCMARVQILCELAITYGEVTKQTKRHAVQMALSNVTQDFK